MKLELLQMGAYRSSRSPCGERGLKWEQRRAAMEKKRVAPRAGSVD